MLEMSAGMADTGRRSDVVSSTHSDTGQSSRRRTTEEQEQDSAGHLMNRGGQQRVSSLILRGSETASKKIARRYKK